ncbi:hypothetical protein Syn7502_03402 [Synechococcus sp. PCC 7502]|uniref:hypothetical protein n=1 Tax=Synechococcus sp. PCC 7502 TaxID=1173263 RepID=UPI00029FC1BB|nr:hypothetical protein [Synechococcus sp. PCC 7502]AFY75254.1 hypothetical protein Syn7502_03402 [Synechococcus sp. PCC 7502]
MTVPRIIDLFGPNVVLNLTDNRLEISLADLQTYAELTTLDDEKGLNIFAAIIRQSQDYLGTRPDEAINAKSEVSVISPTIRNSLQKTEYTFAISFYNPYANLVFDPDNV